MKEPNLRILVDILRKKDWVITERSSNDPILLNNRFKKRYPSIPAELTNFISRIYQMSLNDTCWFICENDYNSLLTGDNFTWDFCEQLSLKSANELSDKNWVLEITNFWNCYLPVMISVKSGYAYISIGVCENNFGKIFYGIEPEFEEVLDVCDSLTEFLNILVRSDSNDFPFAGFI